MIFLWLALFTLYSLGIITIVPEAQQEAYRAAPKDWRYWLGHILFYAVPLSWLWPHDDPSPLALLLALTLILYGSTLAIWAMASNPYFSPAIVRPDTIIATGAYRLCKHPGGFPRGADFRPLNGKPIDHFLVAHDSTGTTLFSSFP